LAVGDSVIFRGFNNGDAGESATINDNSGWRVLAIGTATISGGTYDTQSKPYVDIYDISATDADLAGSCVMSPKHMPPIDFHYDIRLEEEHFQPDTGYPTS
jgi:hypothetical protein